jgi:hypothetical protein
LQTAYGAGDLLGEKASVKLIFIEACNRLIRRKQMIGGEAGFLVYKSVIKDVITLLG